MADIKTIVAHNITELRRARGLTQLDLAEKLNYSDKAVSKWERAESLPDVQTLVALADLFGVTLDALVRETDASILVSDASQKPASKGNKTPILLLSVLLVWLVAVGAFVLLSLAPSLSHEWLCFVAAAPISAIVWLVLNTIWFERSLNYLIVSLLMWSVIAFVHLLLLCLGYGFWMMYLLGVPGQLIIFVWSRMRLEKRA